MRPQYARRVINATASTLHKLDWAYESIISSIESKAKKLSPIQTDEIWATLNGSIWSSMDPCLGCELAFNPPPSTPLDFGTMDKHGLHYWKMNPAGARCAEADRLQQSETESWE